VFAYVGADLEPSDVIDREVELDTNREVAP
jgi:hypothetical protein